MYCWFEKFLFVLGGTIVFSTRKCTIYDSPIYFHFNWILLLRHHISGIKIDKTTKVVVGLPSIRPRFAGKCGRQSKDLTQSHQSD